MMNKNSFLMVLLMLYSICSTAANHWDKRATVGGSKRERGSSFVIGNRGYVCCGQDTLDLMTNDLWEYDPGTNSWTQKANFAGTPRRNAAAFSIGTKGYVGTGINNADAALGMTLNDFWEYNPATNTWTSKAAFPGGGGTGVYYSSGFSLNGKGYFCCGKIGPSYYSNELWEYNPTLNSWASKAPFPGGVRYGGSSFVIGNYAYFGLGTDENMFTNDFYRYDPAINSWTPICFFPGSPRFDCSSFVINNLGYLVFGSDGGYKDELWQYDPNDDYWYAKASFPGGARRSGIAFSINNRGFAGTGKGLSGVRRDFWEYIPTPPEGIEEWTSVDQVTLFPNPMNDRATLQISFELQQQIQQPVLELNSVTGELIQKSSVDKGSIAILRGDLPSGNYLVTLKDGYRTICSKQLIIQ